MEENRNTQIHIIPFDLGCVFIDMLSVDNSNNLLYAKKFISELADSYKEENNNQIEVIDNLKLIYTGKTITQYKYINSELADNAICYVKLNTGLYCYVLSSGIGMFVLADFDGKALQNINPKIQQMNVSLISNYQKKITQSTILNKFLGEDVLPEYEEEMLRFRKKCWSLISIANMKKEISIVRRFSSNINYKAEGLSYVLSIYVFNFGTISDSEINYLMYSSIFNKVTDETRWENINEEITSKQSNLEEKTVIVGTSKVYFSWAGVCVIIPETIKSYSDIVNSSILNTIVKAEIYVQSRWFMADNSMDNVNRSMHCSLESLQRIESLTEFCQAELDNEISANMTTIYKNILEEIIDSSEVRKLYKSVLSQIHTQRKIKEAHYQDKKSKNRLIANLFLAVFTASSLFKTVLDLISNTFDWKNVLIFSLMIVVAVGTVVWDYKNK
ncbi:MAG: hypothetical protein GX660_17275 [Clostridiaceae bacterium]|nr:hypothetical protein [Clostridiaceae bacterium]